MKYNLKTKILFNFSPGPYWRDMLAGRDEETDLFDH